MQTVRADDGTTHEGMSTQPAAGGRPALVVPQAQADKLISKLVQPLPRHYNGQGCGLRAHGAC